MSRIYASWTWPSVLHLLGFISNMSRRCSTELPACSSTHQAAHPAVYRHRWSRCGGCLQMLERAAKGQSLFETLYSTWCHSAGAAISLCLMSQVLPTCRTCTRCVHKMLSLPWLTATA